ncbi:MAG: HU family DNA-binding protein [Muribaculaceae bacterium]|nr:HU family DNA-binding protein [Muribaculaceae bacterium]
MDNKTVIENLSQELEVNKEDIKKLMSVFCKVLSDRCIEGDTVIVPGFGQFEGRKKMERLGNHPSSGRRILIPPKLVLSFKPSAILKSRIQ